MAILELFRKWDDVKEYEAGSVVFKERDPADAIYVILAGEVELSLHGRSLGSEGKGGIIGELAMIESATRSATATALSKVKLARVERARFQSLIGESPEFSLQAMSALANRLRAVDSFIIAQLNDRPAGEAPD